MSLCVENITALRAYVILSLIKFFVVDDVLLTLALMKFWQIIERDDFDCAKRPRKQV
jgi:hypothetical protein